MYTLSPSSLLSRPSKPQHSVPTLKTKRPRDSFSSSCRFLQSTLNNKIQTSFIFKASACDQPFLFNDWPQHLQTSIGSGDISLGQAIHAFLVKWGYQNDSFQGNNLVNLYVKFERLVDAKRVFDEMLVRNTITWTALIKGYLQINDDESVFRISHEMFRLGEEFNEYTCSVILQACKSLDDRTRGEQIHGFVIKSGFEENVFVGTSLIFMYSRSGCFSDAEKVFNNIVYKDVRCLNFMILEYGNAGREDRAIQSFIDLLDSGLEPEGYTLTNVISVCNKNLGVEVCRQLHGLAAKYGFVRETTVGNAIISMYGKHGLVLEAEKMLHRMEGRNLISWTALLSGYVKNDHSEKALSEFVEILQHGICFDSSCLAVVLDGCSDCNNLELGRQIHGLVKKLGYLFDINVATALVDMYAKCSNLWSAKLVFSTLPCQNIAAFNAILARFTETETKKEEVIGLFGQLRLAGMEPDPITFVRLLTLSAHQACLVRGRSLHGYAFKTGFEANSAVGNAVITMYAKCGCIEDAYKMFQDMDSHDCISWNTMISAYAIHGKGRQALLLFEDMKKERFVPDEITILAVLQACNYCGLWEDAIFLFNQMEAKYGIRPVFEHFACVVDLLCHAGHMSEAVDFINKSPFSDSPLLWRTLVHECSLHQEFSLGKTASKYLLDLTPKEAGSYIAVSNMYAGWGMLEVAAKVRTVMNDLRVSKEAGCSWIEIDNKVHCFVASGKDHPENLDIYSNLDLLGAEMKQIYNDRAEISPY